nr:MAG: internal scaffolding protein [Microvirus sp.]
MDTKYNSNYCPLLDIVVDGSPTTDISPVDMFNFEKIDSPVEFLDDDGASPAPCWRMRSDVHLLLHADDVSRNFGVSFAQTLINSKVPKSSSLARAMDDLTDEQLLAAVKSRHLQSPSELLAWSQYLSDHADDILKEANELFESVKQSEESAAPSDTAPSE